MSDALKRLERDGLVSRKVLQTQPIGIEYAMTARGSSLRNPFAALYTWLLTHGSAIARAQQAYDASRRNGGLDDTVEQHQGTPPRSQMIQNRRPRGPLAAD